jgi:polyisoprenoid-binding protein YceI
MFCKPCLIVLAAVASVPFFAATKPAAVSASAPVIAQAAETWKIDSVHSMALFRVQHLGAGMFWGRFDDVQGTITTNGDQLGFDVVIDPATVSSGNDGLNNHLMSPDFFSVKEFPKMTFKSGTSEKTGTSMWKVSGDLTMRGVTKPVTATIEMTGRADMGKGERVGFEATFTVDRGEFGMSYGVDKGAIGKDVRVIVGLEAVGKTAESKG